MKRMLVALPLLVLVLAACGGGDGGTAAETAAGPGGDTVQPPVETDNNETEPADTGTGDTGIGEVTCSATESGLVLEEQDLPPEVAELRERLFAAAGECDYEQLSTIAQESRQFTHNFGGGGGDPAEFWRRQEEGATGEPMYSLQMVLSLPVARDANGSYVWPSAHSPDATDEDWQALVDQNFYFSSDIEEMRESGTGYTGWRTAITPEAEWQYLVAGD